MQGILLVDKPVGWTSFDAVNYIRRLVSQIENKKPRQIKVGHSGTLDPFATGLLIILIGRQYTRLASEYSKRAKVYQVTMKLGLTSSTGDPEGNISEVSKLKPSLDDITNVAKTFEGVISQTPPAYSAVKVDGQRAYKLARQGKSFQLQPRQVTVKSLRVIDYTYPLVRLVSEVSSGTYIRTLVEDIGSKLKVGAYTVELRRLSIDDFNVSQAISANLLNVGNLEQFVSEPKLD